MRKAVIEGVRLQYDAKTHQINESLDPLIQLRFGQCQHALGTELFAGERGKG